MVHERRRRGGEKESGDGEGREGEEEKEVGGKGGN